MSVRSERLEPGLPRHWPRRVRSAVVHAVSMANAAFTISRSWAEHSYDARLRARADNDRLRGEVALLREELRIKDARMERLTAQRRPHYPPIERLAILELRAARGWSLAQTARHLLVTPLTVAAWTQRLDDQGPDALIQTREPVNRFPDFVGYLVRRLKTLCPAVGTWFPLALPQCWPFCWWVAIVIDHFSRRPLGTRTFRKEPSARETTRFLGHVRRMTGCWPRSLISDRGPQLTADELDRFCRRRKIDHRFGAVGKYGSVAVIERFIRSLKNECTHLLPVIPLARAAFAHELEEYVACYGADRPHTRFGARTPDEIYFGQFAACRRPRFEPRNRWPRRSPCAAPHALVRGRPGAVLELIVEHRGGRKHLPVVTLRQVA